MKKIFILAIISILSIGNSSAAEVNSDSSIVDFMVGNMLIREVEGTFKGMTGTVEFDPNNLDSAKFDVCIDASTIDTDNPKRDEHLKSKDWFHVEKYPKICIKGTKIRKLNTGYMLFANVTMYTKTRQEQIPFTFENGVFKGNVELMRLKYRVGKGTSTKTVSDEVMINIKCVLK